MALYFPLSSRLVAEQVTPIRIGATLSLEGKFSEPSLMMQDGYRLWEKLINERGGMLGRPVKLILYDDKSDASLVRRYYEKLISEDKVDLLLSPYGTALTLPAAEVAERHGYVMLAAGTSGDELWSRGFKRIFGVYGPARRYFIGLLDLMASNGMDSVAVLYEDSPFGKDVAGGVGEWAQRFGLRVSLYEMFHSGEKDLPALLDRVKEANADGLIVASYPEDSYYLVRLLQQKPYRPRVLAFTIASAHPEFYAKAGSFAEGVFGASQWEPDERIPFPGTKRFIADFIASTGRMPSYHAGSAYASCEILQRAVKLCSCLDQNRLADTIRSLDSVTVIGRFKVDHSGRQTGHNSFIIQWQNGKKEIVYPMHMQTAPPRF